MNFHDTNALFDYLINAHGLKNDRALAQALGVAAPVICKVRKGNLKLGAVLIIYIHEYSGLSVAEIKTAIKT